MLLGLQNVTFEFGARTIVRNATWHIQPNERIGFIGYNGTGKSTILKVMTGQYTPSEGTVEKSKETTIGYLHQDLLGFESDENIRDVALLAFDRVLQLQEEIDEMGKELEKTGDEALAHKYAEKLQEFQLAGGYEMEHKTEEVLQGLGFSNDDLARPYAEFSGGWRMRVLLAQMILKNPDVLLLDEPTNHLDLPSIEWLEKYLQHYPGAVVIVSHDRYFLDRMVTKIVELYQQELHFYTGNYSFYLKEKEQQIEIQQRAYENQQAYIRQQERFIERFRSKATKAAQAQSAIKRLEKLDRIENTELEKPNIKINFSVGTQPGKIICRLKHATKYFGDIEIVKDTSIEIDRGDKIALIGANGKGKSTLLRMIAGTESFDGERIPGHNVEQSFYAQHQLEALTMDYTILEEMQYAGTGKTDLELRTLLGSFLFSGEEVEKKIRVLSGGEKARVALAKTIASKGNFLLLDEPTNHLDINSVDLLVEALRKYEGTFIVVSHDRYFVSRIATKIWEIQDFQVKEFVGTYDEWVQWKEEHPAIKKETAEVVTPEPAVEKPKIDSNEARQQLKEQQRIKNQFEKAGKLIDQLTREKEALELKLASPEVYADNKKFTETEKEYQKKVKQLATENKRYEQLFEQVMEMEDE